MHLLTHVRARFGRALGSATTTSPQRTERRYPTRLMDGELRPCPDCSGMLQFRESYRIWRIERNTLEPAWVCQTHPCGYREFVRR